jgi:hypothetical protein
MFLVSLVLLLASVNSASADTHTWTNNYPWSVLWDDAPNWDPAGVPGASDEAFINPPPERGPVIDCDVNVGDIHGPRWDSDSNQVMNIAGGTVVVNGEWVWCNSGSGTGTINISGSPNITIDQWLSGIYSGTGILNISDSPTITSNGEWRMVDGGGAVGIFNIGGSANITIHDRVRLADNGLAILNISGDPNIIIDDDLTGGYGSGGTLEAYISSGSLYVGGSFQIGNDGGDVIDINGGTVSCRNLILQVYPDDATAVFNVNDGDVYVEETLRICDGSGTAAMNMSGGNVNTGELWLPGGDGVGILNMTGGLLTVRGAMLAPRYSNGTSVINLDGGVISCGVYTPAGAYSMDIDEGVLIIDGDVRDAINADIAAYYITAYGGCGGRGDVMVDFDNVNPGKTTVWAVPVFERAWNPWPDCDAEYIPKEVVLSWSAGDGAIEHLVYFDTNFDDVNEGSLIVYKGSQTSTMYNAGTLSFGVTYYWRIDEFSGSMYTPGLVWSFTLGDIIVVDDMEDYNDNYPITGDGGSYGWESHLTNGTKAYLVLVTDDEYGWLSINGQQAMAYMYKNPYSPYYAEISNHFALEPCDWTAYGVKSLTLCFYGDPRNDANDTEQMYVGLEDSNSDYAEVRYGDGDGEDMNDIRIEEWQQWNIALQDFNDGGVDLTDVNRLYIGFGYRDNPVAGGSGVVYFDDIILYPTRCIPERGPVGDVSGDCVVDFADLDIMADEWLDSGNLVADVYEDNKIDFKDYALLMNHWLEMKLWPPQ